MRSGLHLGRGSKRSVQRIRWTKQEIASAILLLVVISFFAVIVGVWVGTHHID